MKYYILYDCMETFKRSINVMISCHFILIACRKDKEPWKKTFALLIFDNDTLNCNMYKEPRSDYNMTFSIYTYSLVLKTWFHFVCVGSFSIRGCIASSDELIIYSNYGFMKIEPCFVSLQEIFLFYQFSTFNSRQTWLINQCRYKCTNVLVWNKYIIYNTTIWIKYPA